MRDYPTAQKGTWTLIAPDGRKWKGPNPLKLAAIENAERVPATERLRRIEEGVKETLLPCWCPYCGEPHSPAVREHRDATQSSGQHDGEGVKP